MWRSAQCRAAQARPAWAPGLSLSSRPCRRAAPGRAPRGGVGAGYWRSGLRVRGQISRSAAGQELLSVARQRCGTRRVEVVPTQPGPSRAEPALPSHERLDVRDETCAECTEHHPLPCLLTHTLDFTCRRRAPLDFAGGDRESAVAMR